VTVKPSFFQPVQNPLRPPKFVPLSEVGPSAHPVFLHIRDQLPQGLRDRLGLKIEMDSYFLGCTAVFFTEDGKQFKARLGPTTMPDGWAASTLIPDELIAHMCLVV